MGEGAAPARGLRRKIGPGAQRLGTAICLGLTTVRAGPRRPGVSEEQGPYPWEAPETAWKVLTPPVLAELKPEEHETARKRVRDALRASLGSSTHKSARE